MALIKQKKSQRTFRGKKLIFDIETNGLLNNVDTCHCIVACEPSTGQIYIWTQEDCIKGAIALSTADELIGHNIIEYDIPCLKQLFPQVSFESPKIYDTIVMSRLVRPDIKARDYNRKGFDKKLIGSYSLKAWGLRLGILKGDFGETTDWSEYSDEMLNYCIQDVKVTLELYNRIEEEGYSECSKQIEHDFVDILFKQRQRGFNFDIEGAKKLTLELKRKQNVLKEQLQEVFPPKAIQLKTKVKYINFNPASGDQIAERLMKLGWKPEIKTPTGKVKVDEEILSHVTDPKIKPFADMFIEYKLLDKRISQISKSKGSWIKYYNPETGCIHGRVTHIGAVTGRTSASHPNIQQVPAAYSPYGKECRSLFIAPEGWKLVGIDVSGLELRCLAHYMSRYDKGSYAKEMLDGDIHTVNQKAAGLAERNDAKTFIYAFIYGGGNAKLGEIVGGGFKDGEKLRRRFFNKLPALKSLMNAVQKTVEERGYLKGIDGRIVPIRSPHSALNALLQGMGAIICKAWVIETHKILKENGLILGRDWEQVAYVHDEVQLITKPELTEKVGQLAVKAIENVGKNFNVRLPLTGEYGVGNTWAETH